MGIVWHIEAKHLEDSLPDGLSIIAPEVPVVPETTEVILPAGTSSRAHYRHVKYVNGIVVKGMMPQNGRYQCPSVTCLRWFIDLRLSGQHGRAKS